MLTFNIFRILRDVKNAKIRTLYWKKESIVSLADFKLKCFSFVHIYNPRRINGILR